MAVKSVTNNDVSVLPSHANANTNTSMYPAPPVMHTQNSAMAYSNSTLNVASVSPIPIAQTYGETQDKTRHDFLHRHTRPQPTVGEVVLRLLPRHTRNFAPHSYFLTVVGSTTRTVVEVSSQMKVLAVDPLQPPAVVRLGESMMVSRSVDEMQRTYVMKDDEYIETLQWKVEDLERELGQANCHPMHTHTSLRLQKENAKLILSLEDLQHEVQTLRGGGVNRGGSEYVVQLEAQIEQHKHRNRLLTVQLEEIRELTENRSARIKSLEDDLASTRNCVREQESRMNSYRAELLHLQQGKQHALDALDREKNFHQNLHDHTHPSLQQVSLPPVSHLPHLNNTTIPSMLHSTVHPSSPLIYHQSALPNSSSQSNIHDRIHNHAHSALPHSPSLNNAHIPDYDRMYSYAPPDDHHEEDKARFSQTHPSIMNVQHPTLDLHQTSSSHTQLADHPPPSAHTLTPVHHTEGYTKHEQIGSPLNFRMNDHVHKAIGGNGHRVDHQEDALHPGSRLHISVDKHSDHKADRFKELREGQIREEEIKQEIVILKEVAHEVINVGAHVEYQNSHVHDSSKSAQELTRKYDHESRGGVVPEKHISYELSNQEKDHTKKLEHKKDHEEHEHGREHELRLKKQEQLEKERSREHRLEKKKENEAKEMEYELNKEHEKRQLKREEMDENKHEYESSHHGHNKADHDDKHDKKIEPYQHHEAHSDTGRINSHDAHDHSQKLTHSVSGRPVHEQDKHENALFDSLVHEGDKHQHLKGRMSPSMDPRMKSASDAHHLPDAEHKKQQSEHHTSSFSSSAHEHQRERVHNIQDKGERSNEHLHKRQEDEIEEFSVHRAESPTSFHSRNKHAIDEHSKKKQESQHGHSMTHKDSEHITESPKKRFSPRMQSVNEDYHTHPQKHREEEKEETQRHHLSKPHKHYEEEKEEDSTREHKHPSAKKLAPLSRVSSVTALPKPYHTAQHKTEEEHNKHGSLHRKNTGSFDAAHHSSNSSPSHNQHHSHKDREESKEQEHQSKHHHLQHSPSSKMEV